VVLVAPRNPLNIGAAARAMANFGCARLRIVNPYESRSASAIRGCTPRRYWLPRGVRQRRRRRSDCTLVVGTTSVGHRELQHPLRRLEYGARLIRRQLAKVARSLAVRSEKFGLSTKT